MKYSDLFLALSAIYLAPHISQVSALVLGVFCFGVAIYARSKGD